MTGTQILARDIADNHSNVTRFIVLAQQDAAPTGHDKTSFCFGFREDRAGVLVGALQTLAEETINMTKLESRPSKEVLGQYIFLIDIEGHRNDAHVARALDRIAARTGMFKIFGSYPRWRAQNQVGN
jgi:prephenate dehydratase